MSEDNSCKKSFCASWLKKSGHKKIGVKPLTNPPTTTGHAITAIRARYAALRKPFSKYQPRSKYNTRIGIDAELVWTSVSPVPITAPTSVISGPFSRDDVRRPTPAVTRPDYETIQTNTD